MNWFLLVTISAILMTVRIILQRFLLRDKGDAQAFTILHDLFAGIGIFPFFLLFGFSYPTSLIPFIALLVATLFYAAGDLTSIKSSQLEEASLVSPLLRLRNIFVLLGSALFLGEKITLLKIISVIFIILGSFIICSEKRKVNFSKGVIFAIMASFFLACAVLLDKAFVLNYSLPTYMSLVLYLPAFWIFLFTKNKSKRVIKELKLQKFGVVITGLFFGWSLFSLLAAIAVGEVSRVVPVFELSLVLVVLGGVIILKENEKIVKKFIGSLFILLGVALIGM